MSEATYMVECYWPGVTPEQVEHASGRAQRSAEELTRAGTPVEYLGSILVPDDEVVFLLFGGRSAQSVREAGERAEIPFERIRRSLMSGQGPALQH